jgi:hypothetical protein
VGRERARLSATAAGEMTRDELFSSVSGQESRGKRRFDRGARRRCIPFGPAALLY